MDAQRVTMSEALLKPGERLDDLQNGGLRLIQRPDAFRFGTDSVLLADFAEPRLKDEAVDLGCGTGAIGILMAAHQPKVRVDLVELQQDIADMAGRSVILNGLDDRLRVFAMDMRACPGALGREKYTLAVCNPPYGRRGAGLESANPAVRLARHEVALTPDEMAACAFSLLRTGGRFCVVWPAARLAELFAALTNHRLTPKRIRTVHGVEGRPPRRVLLEACKDAGPELKWLPPLVLQDANGAPTEEFRRIYRMNAQT